jgi:hypothetical protein
MGSDMYMNPPQPVYETETIFRVGKDPEAKILARLVELLDGDKSFHVTPVADGVTIKVHTGEFI